MKKEKNNKSKKVKTIVVKDYSNMIVDYLYSSKKFIIGDNQIVKKDDCYSLNYMSRNKNIFNFNKTLHESIIYFIKRKNIPMYNIKTMLGASTHEMNSIFNENNFDRNMNFKLVYDICQALDVDMKEVVERMEGEFTK